MYPQHGRHVSYQGQPSFTLGKAPMMRTHSTPQAQLLQMQAAQVINGRSTKHDLPRSTLSQGGKAFKVSSHGEDQADIKPRSQVEIVGPFKTQVHNLSSSEYSGSTESSPEQHVSPAAALLATHRVVQIKTPAFSPKTPTRKGPVPSAHLLESPANDTDWVAYSAPIPELDEIDLDMGDQSFESYVTESTASRSSTPDTMIERTLDTENVSASSSTECDDEQASRCQFPSN